MIDWIINYPQDAFMLAWTMALKPCVIVGCIVFAFAFIISRVKKANKKSMVVISIVATLLISLVITGVRVYGYFNPALITDPGHENYSAHFNDVQRVQIKAAERYGINPLKDRQAAEKAINENALTQIRSNGVLQLAPMGHSIPYLTESAAELLNTIGENFQDSLSSKNMSSHKIVVTSILRTDADVEQLMKRNNVAVRNSAHRYATTFDISYTKFIPDGISSNSSRSELKKELAEVLRDLRDDKQCYVKYEKSQNCFHITVRK